MAHHQNFLGLAALLVLSGCGDIGSSRSSNVNSEETTTNNGTVDCERTCERDGDFLAVSVFCNGELESGPIFYSEAVAPQECFPLIDQDDAVVPVP